MTPRRAILRVLVLGTVLLGLRSASEAASHATGATYRVHYRLIRATLGGETVIAEGTRLISPDSDTILPDTTLPDGGPAAVRPPERDAGTPGQKPAGPLARFWRRLREIDQEPRLDIAEGAQHWTYRWHRPGDPALTEQRLEITISPTQASGRESTITARGPRPAPRKTPKPTRRPTPPPEPPP